MPGPNSEITRVDGTVDFAGGVNSVKVTTIQSEVNPGGLARNELSWLINGTTRDGGITPRAGWEHVVRVHDGSAIFQGGYMYEPRVGFAYLVYAIGGHIYSYDIETAILRDLSVEFGEFHPAAEPYYYYIQAEEFLVIQAGDMKTLPLIWDGATLRRSIGITNAAVAPGTPGVNEIPVATCMEYYMGRLWYAQYRTYSAGDIVGGPSGTAAYEFRDAVLNVTENPLCVGGDGFTVPSQAGNIRVLKKSAAIDTTLGEGRLFIGTRKEMYALTVPVTRANWIAADTDNQPLQSVVQIVNGPVNDRSAITINGDLFYQSLEPGIRSLFLAIRNFNQWGNVDLSANERRILKYNDRALMRHGSGIEFDNRLLMTALPKETPQGVIHDALVPLDFVPVSHMGAQRAPAWQGHYEGLQFLQLFAGDFGGRERAFALCVSKADSGIDLWELTYNSQFDSPDNRITTIVEFPAFTWGNEFAMKKLVGAELWLDRLYGTVEFLLEWRPDGEWCWYKWHEWDECTARTSAELPEGSLYPLEQWGEAYRSTITIPRPPLVCADSQLQVGRPAHIGYQFQARLTFKGFCRIRGILLHAEMVERKLYANLTC
jgi:hypothetical protein